MTVKTARQAAAALNKMAQDLRIQAAICDQSAQAVCDHRNEDGSFAVVRGLYIDSPCCSICELDECYIPIYSRVPNDLETP